MKIYEIIDEGVGKVVKGSNTTKDVKKGEIKRQAKKFGFTLDDNGNPPITKTNGKIDK